MFRPHTSPNGRLLTTGFYGYSPDHAVPWEKNGLGRVVREVYEDGTFGPIHFIYFMTESGWNIDKLPYPLYESSSDPGFVDACRHLLADKFETQQWAEENGNDCKYVSLKTHNEALGKYENHPYQAFARYHINDKKVVALWKHAIVGISFDNGDNWKIKKENSFVTSGAKAWGQVTSDGRFAILYVNSLSSEHRYPLVCITSSNGIEYDNLASVFGETPPRRYSGLNKDFGPQYMRGISESCHERPDEALWLTYSVNKEDIWVSRIPVPISDKATGYFCGSFINNLYLDPWNIYSSKWASVENRNGIMVISDRDPVDYAVAELNFPECERFKTTIELQCEKYDKALEIELTDRSGNICSRLYIENGHITGRHTSVRSFIGDFNEQIHTITIVQDCCECCYSVSIDGNKEIVLRNMQKINKLSRLIIRTKPRRNAPGMEIRPVSPDLKGSDEPVDLREYRIFSVNTIKL